MIVRDDCRSVLPKLPARSIDAVVCDPPYELKRDRRGAGFMGQTWDSDSGAFDAATWEQVVRACKPGAWVAAFGGRRTWHHLAVAMEAGGLVPRDTFLWAYSTGNVTAPKTTVKPVFEPICVMQVPALGSIEASVEAYGTGYLGVDESRIPYLDAADLAKTMAKNPGRSDTFTSGVYGTDRPQQRVNPDGRHPSGLILDPDLEVDALLGDFQRFVVVPKASRKERDLGLPSEESIEEEAKERSTCSTCLARTYRQEECVCDPEGDAEDYDEVLAELRGRAIFRNPHTAVKPVGVMEWLIGLLCPAGGTVLDPWIGSGTTGVAAAHRGREVVGVEREDIYAEVAELRVTHAYAQAVCA